MKLSVKKILLYSGIILLAILTVGLVWKFLQSLDVIMAGIGGMVGALRSIVLGCVMAYLLFPLTRFTEHFLLYRKVNKKAARRLSTAFSTVVLLTLIVLFFYFIVPELVNNLPALVQDLPFMIRDAFNQLTLFLRSHEIPTDFLMDISTRITTTFNDWLAAEPLDDLITLLNQVMDLAKALLNFVIGIIVMVYVLMSRDQFVGQSKKILFALCRKQSTCDTVLKHLRVINQIFSGFVSGKLLDSLIIGILCSITLSILNIPYAALISVIVGITNVIPVFGPFFGAVPSAILLVLTDPAKCVVFIIFIIILQQIDGNIIGPKILGDSTGLSAFWVLFSLLLFNHLMGFWGMLLGVPIFASFYYLLREFINARLRKKDLPVDTTEYVHAVGLSDDGSISTAEPKLIQFSPLIQGDDSYWARSKRWFFNIKNEKTAQLRNLIPDDGDEAPSQTPDDSDPTGGDHDA